MEIKKNPVLLIHKERPLFTLLGFIVSFTIAFISLSFTFYSENTQIIDDRPIRTTDVTMLVFKPEEPEPEKPKPEVKAKPIADVFRPIDREPDPEPKPKETTPETPATATVIPPVPETFPIIDTSIIDVAAIETPPEFVGGQDALEDFLRANLKYPKAALLYEIEGRVIINFVVEKDGRVSQVRLQNGTVGYDLDQEALRVVNLLPKFKPGMYKKHPVRVLCSIPIEFILFDDY